MRRYGGNGKNRARDEDGHMSDQSLVYLGVDENVSFGHIYEQHHIPVTFIVRLDICGFSLLTKTVLLVFWRHKLTERESFQHETSCWSKGYLSC